MARIRTIKPEFWDSPSTAKASPWARLLFIAMWNWADDFGRGTANLKELEGFAFPNDDTFTDSSGNTVHFRALVAEVSECFGVLFYEVDNRPYFEIPSWDAHQRNERRSKASKYPSPQVRSHVAEIPCSDTETPNISGTGTGEQGNRGTGEQSTSSSDANASDPGAEKPEQEFSEETQWLCNHLADKIRTNGNKVGTVGTRWHQAMDRLQRIDGYSPDQIRQVIDWCQQDEFWQGNILSAQKLREKFDQLKTRMFNERQKPVSTGNRATDRMRAGYEAMAGYTPNTPDPWAGKELEQ